MYETINNNNCNPFLFSYFKGSSSITNAINDIDNFYYEIWISKMLSYQGLWGNNIIWDV